MTFRPEKSYIGDAKKDADPKPIREVIKPFVWTERFILVIVLVGFVAGLGTVLFGHSWLPYGGAR